MCHWSVNDKALTDVYAAFGANVDWINDAFIIFGKEEQPHPYITSRTKPFYCHTVHRYGLDVKVALSQEFK